MFAIVIVVQQEAQNMNGSILCSRIKKGDWFLYYKTWCAHIFWQFLWLLFTVTWSNSSYVNNNNNRAKPGLCIHSLWFLALFSTSVHYKTPSDSDHTLCLEVQFAWSILLPNSDPGVIVFFSLSEHTLCVTANSRTSYWSWNVMTAPVLHLASRINSCSGLIVSCQRGLKATYFVYSVSKMTLSPMDVYRAFTVLLPPLRGEQT